LSGFLTVTVDRLRSRRLRVQIPPGILLSATWIYPRPPFLGGVGLLMELDVTRPGGHDRAEGAAWKRRFQNRLGGKLCETVLAEEDVVLALLGGGGRSPRMQRPRSTSKKRAAAPGTRSKTDTTLETASERLVGPLPGTN